VSLGLQASVGFGPFLVGYVHEESSVITTLLATDAGAKFYLCLEARCLWKSIASTIFRRHYAQPKEKQNEVDRTLRGPRRVDPSGRGFRI
jgi:hypothetical protein